MTVTWRNSNSALNEARDYLLDTPIEERLAECLALSEKLDSNFSVEGFSEIGAMLLLLCRTEDSYEVTAELLGAARLLLLDINDKATAEKASKIATFSIAAGLAALHGITINSLALKAKRSTGLKAINEAKSNAIEAAKISAIKLWAEDSAQSVRLSEMADRVYRALCEEGYADSLPGSSDRVKEWIKPVAPDYARKGGRSRSKN